MTKDPRATRLAHNLVTFSLGVKPGEKVLIETRGIDLPFVADLIRKDGRFVLDELQALNPENLK